MPDKSKMWLDTIQLDYIDVKYNVCQDSHGEGRE